MDNSAPDGGCLASLSLRLDGANTRQHLCTPCNEERKWKCVLLASFRLEYDTIQDAILTCARKPTRVGLIYRTETTTKNCKTEKLKSRRRYVRSNDKSLGNHVGREAGSWFQRRGEAYWKERSVIRREDDVDRRASVTKDDERVLRGG